MHSRHSQRGQAISELIAAMAVFVPLVLAVIYAGKYADVKHQAIQASRYAALERAMDPKQEEDDTVIGDETVARFFRDGSKYNIGFQDKATGDTTDDLNANWKKPEDGGAPLIASYSDITVKLSRTDVTGATLAGIEAPAGTQFNELSTGKFGVQADVEVALVAADHGPLAAFTKPLNFKVGATTVMAGDTWSAATSRDVANHFTPLSVPGRTLSSLTTVLDPLFDLLTDAGAPKFGCIKPDVVPQADARKAQYSPKDACL